MMECHSALTDVQVWPGGVFLPCSFFSKKIFVRNPLECNDQAGPNAMLGPKKARDASLHWSIA